MDASMKGHEVLEIAEKIERNGARFYRRAAAMVQDTKVSAFLVQLAQWESQHVKVFREMKERSVKQKWEIGDIAPGHRGVPNARSLAGLAVFGLQPNPADELTGQETRADVLRIAIEKEKDSIVYYTGLKDLIPSEKDRKLIEDIIQEEMKHVRILAQSLEQLE
ncbi:MAG: ferritin family protein [Phycisphaerales bacterium]|nr:MAG: ferritin family protein [Phycisphaerales bacterium]